MKLTKARLIEIIKEEMDASLMPQPLDPSAKYKARSSWSKAKEDPSEEPKGSELDQGSSSSEEPTGLKPADLDPVTALKAEYQKQHAAIPTDKQLLKYAAKELQRIRKEANPAPKPEPSSDKTEIGGTDYLKKVSGLFKE